MQSEESIRLVIRAQYQTLSAFVMAIREYTARESSKLSIRKTVVKNPILQSSSHASTQNRVGRFIRNDFKKIQSRFFSSEQSDMGFAMISQSKHI